MIIYHITTKQEWEMALFNGEYIPVNFSVDGFIHCSTKEQAVNTANRFYSGQTDLVLLKIDTSLLSVEVKEENLEGGAALFPHIYGHLPVKAVVTVSVFSSTPQGFVFPNDL